MMNSIRASPTPSLGMKDNAKASSGLPTFIMIFVRGRRMLAEIDVLDRRMRSLPS